MARIASSDRCPACRAPTRASANFCAQCGSPLGAAAPRRKAIRELRQVTVVFCDLVGSSKLSVELHPEDLTALLARFHYRVTDIMAAHGGFTARFLGDGSLSYFGYPSASENDMTQAVRASLEAIEAVGELVVAGARLHARIGIASGVSLIGELVGSSGLQGIDVSGEAPNLAARLQSIADPDTVIVDRSVFEAVRSTFECESLGRQTLKGWTEPVPIWRVLRQAAAVDRFAADAIGSASPMVGREAPLAALSAAWRASCSGLGKAILLVGEAGVGKSRLVQSFVQTLAASDFTRLASFGRQHQQTVPLHPLVQQIGENAGFTASDTPKVKLQKLRMRLRDLPREDFRLIADLFVSPADFDEPPLELAPHRRRTRTMQALITRLAELAGRNPVMVIVEDAQWLDPTSLELLDALVRQVARMRVLVIVTGRPEVSVAWRDEPQAQVLGLGLLDATDAASIVRASAGDATLDAVTVQRIVERSDGNPLYLEEVTKAVLELDGRGKGWRKPAQLIPASIHASLLARLDGLGPVRAVAEIAATIGREFNIEMLRCVSGLPAAELSAALERLGQSGLVFPLSGSRSGQYRFKHALIQDAAYGTIVRPRRAELHALTAAALEQRFPDLSASDPSLVAHHYASAGMTSKAVVWFVRSATQSLERSSVTEAMGQLGRASDLLASLPDDVDRSRAELEVCVTRGKALIAARGHAARETGETFARARELCRRLDDPPQLLTVLFGQWTHTLFRASLDEAQGMAEEIFGIATARGDSKWRLIGCYALGFTRVPAGEFIAGRALLEQGISLYDETKRQQYASPVVGDPRIVMRTYLSFALLCLGETEAAHELCALARKEARALGQVWALAQALYHTAFCHAETGAVADALPHLEELATISSEYGFLFYSALSQMLRGWCRSRAGDRDGGLHDMRAGLTLYGHTNALLYVSSNKRLYAEMLGWAGRPAEGLQALDEARTLMQLEKSFWDHSEMERIRGELLWGLGDHDQACACLESAVTIAQAQGARLFAGRAAAALARLRHETTPVRTAVSAGARG